MARYDVPASIDYVLNVTGQRKLASVVGFSLGTNLFFMGAHHLPHLNNQTETLIGLGPSGNSANLSNYYRHIAPYVKIYQVITITR